MTREQRLNRPKRLRIAMEMSGNGAKANHSEAIEVLAKDKTPKVQRIGNYYVKVKQGSRNQFVNVVPRHKLTKRPSRGLFLNVLNYIKSKLGK